MSGCEVLGLVLGLYPIVVTAWEVYSQTREGKGIRSLLSSLKTQQIIYREFLIHLLGPNVEEAQLLRLQSATDPRDLRFWQDAALQSSIRERLGFIKGDHIMRILIEVAKLLRSMENDLPGVGGSFETRSIRFFKNFKHNLPQSPLRAYLEALKEYNTELKDLLSERGPPSSSSRETRPVPTFVGSRQNRSNAVDVFKAICDGYQCDCHAPHYANLELPQLPQIDNPKLRSAKHSPTDDRRLQLLFPIDDTPFIHPAIDNENETRDDNPESKDHKARTVSIYECPDDPSDIIQDLCQYVRALRGDNLSNQFSEGTGILSSKEKKYKLQPPSPEAGENSQNITSLEEMADAQSLLSRRDRMSLALRLSYAILQYYSTGWIDAEWSWKDFSMTGGQLFENSNLFVQQKFYSAGTPTQTTTTFHGIWAIIGEPILTRLGFALIELALGKRLSELRDGTIDSTMPTDHQEYQVACNILKSGRVEREEGKVYEEVVRVCLKHQFFSHSESKIKSLDSRDTSFHKDVENLVIVPLHYMWDKNWG